MSVSEPRPLNTRRSQPFSLTGSVSRCCLFSGQASVSLQRVGDTDPIFSIESPIGTESFDESGFLSAGSYELRAEAFAFVLDVLEEDTGSFDFVFLVPEPSTALLLGGGFTILGIVRRRAS